MSRVYTLKRIQSIPVPVGTAWDFFATPVNLTRITPADMGFTLQTAYDRTEMYAGQIIEYTVRPLWGIPVYWMTEITHVDAKKYFADEQRFGPYSLWHHEHHFREIEGGTEMTDLIFYKIPYWFAGDIANTLFVRKKLASIFDFRYRKIEEVFGKWPGA